MKIDILHIDACPNWEDAGRVITELIDELGIAGVEPTFTLIRTPEDAAKVAFAGSPTILIDGVDVDPGSAPTTDLACRIYRNGQRTAGLPTKDALREAILSQQPPR